MVAQAFDYEEARDVHLNPDFDAELLHLWPRGEKANAIAFYGVFDLDSMPGTNEAHGDGVVNNANAGLADRSTVVVETWREHPDTSLERMEEMLCPTGRIIKPKAWFRRVQPDHNPDVIYRPLTGLQFPVKRIRGLDEVMISVLAVNSEFVRTGRGRQTG